MKCGVQLYSVRDMAAENFEQMLKEVAALGYEYVEPAGFFGHSAEQVKEWLDKYNLKVSSTHSSISELIDDFEGTVKYHKTIGNTKYILGSVPTIGIAELEEYSAKINDLIPKLAEHGIEMGFHNHHKEFIPNNNCVIPINYLMEKTKLKFEIDIFWAFAARENPIDVMERMADRLIGYIHLKDGNLYPKAAGCALGEGSAPLRDVIAKAKDLNQKIIVESEGLSPTGIEEVTRCTQYLKDIGF